MITVSTPTLPASAPAIQRFQRSAQRTLPLPQWSAQRTLHSSPCLRVSVVPNRHGVTLVEVLVAVTIVGSLMAILLPAVQASREQSRQTACANNLRQQGLAVQQHVQAFGRFPCNGWGYLWVGDPNRGNDQRQPGGWIYNLIVYTQPKTHREIGKGRDREADFARLLAEPAPLFVCPSRGDGRPRPAASWLPPFNGPLVALVAKTDYAICEGDYITDTQGGPETLEQGDSDQYDWKDTRPATGISYLRSAVRPAHVQDGLSNTYLIGEKYVSYGGYETHDDPGYDQTMYTGVDLDGCSLPGARGRAGFCG